MKVGYCSSNYQEKRNIIEKIPAVKYVNVYDTCHTLSLAIQFINKKIFHTNFSPSNDLFHIFQDFGMNKVDLIHFFNTIALCDTPWISTFETIVPRFESTLSCHHGPDFGYSSLLHDRRIHRALGAMSSQSCKKLIAMSECNLNIQKKFLSYFPKYEADIEKKLTVLRPPQPQFFKSFEEKNISLEGSIRFLFVGRAFFRKGGKEILEAFIKCRQKPSYDINLTIVSSLEIDNYATKENKSDVKEARRLIHQNREWINHFWRLSNSDVIKLMKKAHIGLLPTYADTYGYSVLEFQAAGCPVISTDVRALPELNNGEMGWVIDVAKNELGEGLYTTEQNRVEMARAIKSGLVDAITEIMESKNMIGRKADLALERIKAQHSPDVYARKLWDIYKQALR